MNKCLVLAVLVWLLSFPTFARASCLDRALPVQTPPTMPVTHIASLKISLEDSLQASFLFENRSAKSVSFLTLVIDYATEMPDHLAVVYEATTSTLQAPKDLIPAQYVQSLPAPILPGQRKWIRGSSPYILADCPTSARLVMIDVRFEDKSRLDWSSPDWLTMPLLSGEPEDFRVSDSSAWSAETYYFLAKIDQDGHLKDSAPIAPTVTLPSHNVQECLTKLVFSPSMLNGKPHDGGIIIAVNFHRTPTTGAAPHAVEVPSLRGPRVAIDLYPRNSDSADWIVNFGGTWRPASKRDPNAG
jgi:hypothetical protein